MTRQTRIQQASKEAYDLMNTLESKSFFDDLDEYVYLPPEIAKYLTYQDLDELELFDKKT